MSEDIVGRRMLLGMGVGAGAMALAARRAEADVPFSSFAFAATGSPTARTMPDRLAEIKNVKDFGARGNGSTDDTAAIQSAVNATAGTNRGTVCFPLGTYRITAPITFTANPVNIRFLGEPGATIVGNFADALLKRLGSIGGSTGGIHVVENLRLINNHLAGGKGLIISECIGAKVVDCHISAWRGIEMGDSSAVTIDTCSLVAPVEGEGVGIVAENATTILNSDITHFGEGIRHCNLGLSVIGGRHEVNGVGIMIGKKGDGSTFQSSGFHISGLSMESNGHGIYVHAGAAGKIAGCAITNNIAGKSSGIYMNNAEQVALSGVSVASGHSFSDAGIYLENPLRCTFDAVRINVAGGLAWRLPTNGQLAACGFRATLPVVEGSVTVANLATHGSAAPIGTILRVSNANKATVGAKITGTGTNDVMALKIYGNAWTVLGTGT